MSEIIDLIEEEVLQVESKVEIQHIESILLTAEREKELAKIIQNPESSSFEIEKAVSEMAMANVNLVKSIAFSYSKKSKVEIEELTSVGYEGLMTAIYKFSPDYGKFSTYAVHWIKQAIRKFIRESSIVSIPAYTQNNLYKQNQINKGLPDGQELTDEEVKSELNLTDDGLENLKKARVSAVSFDDHVGHDDDGEDGFNLYDIVPDENTEHGIDLIERDEKIAIMKIIVSSLPEMERDIIVSQCMNESKENLADIGQRWGLTGERVRQIREETFASIRKELEKRMA